ncbi:MAG: hypothetical protein ACM3X1_02945 [Ignavibacteriales bacterium]
MITYTIPTNDHYDKERHNFVLRAEGLSFYRQGARYVGIATTTGGAAGPQVMP